MGGEGNWMSIQGMDDLLEECMLKASAWEPDGVGDGKSSKYSPNIKIQMNFYKVPKQIS